jgi:poly(A) polymerase
VTNYPPQNLLDWFQDQNQAQLPIYLVGGAVRDQMMGIESRDFDFAVQNGAVELARKVADYFKAAFYVLDEERGTARVLLNENSERLTLDFANLRGENLEADLYHRDFTFNAIARKVSSPQDLIDPLHGKADISSGIVRACSPAAFQDDPVRCLRAVRFSFQFNFKIETTTQANLQKAVSLLLQSSIERQRDELFNILSIKDLKAALQCLLELGIISQLLPELVPLVDLRQTAHHAHDAWLHTLAVVDYCNQLLDWIYDSNANLPGNRFLKTAMVQLAPFQKFLQDYFNDPDFYPRPLREIFLFAALYHDVGKPSTRGDLADGAQFIDHDSVGTRIAASRARELALSNREVDFIEGVIRNHMLIHPMVKQPNLDLREGAYRYYQAAGLAGVADCIFSLADLLSTYEERMDPDRWQAGIKMSVYLLDAWMNHYRDVIQPPLLLDGDELKLKFTLDSGPLIGQLLAELEHAQVIGKVCSKQEAFEFIQARLDEIIGENDAGC